MNPNIGAARRHNASMLLRAIRRLPCPPYIAIVAVGIMVKSLRSLSGRVNFRAAYGLKPQSGFEVSDAGIPNDPRPIVKRIWTDC